MLLRGVCYSGIFAVIIKTSQVRPWSCSRRLLTFISNILRFVFVLKIILKALGLLAWNPWISKWQQYIIFDCFIFLSFRILTVSHNHWIKYTLVNFQFFFFFLFFFHYNNRLSNTTSSHLLLDRIYVKCLSSVLIFALFISYLFLLLIKQLTVCTWI